MVINAFDYSIIVFLNAMAQKSLLFDGLTARIDGYLFKGGVMMAFFWWAWFAVEGKADTSSSLKTVKLESKKRKQDINQGSPEGQTLVDEWRSKLIAVALGSIVSLFVARFLALTLPFRSRPRQNPILGQLEWPYFVNPDTLGDWSSFPSDHAALFFALAIGLFYISRIMGMLACGYTFLFILMPRIYTGLHYPTDIIAGTLIAAVCAVLLQLASIRMLVTGPFILWFKRHPASFYTSTFLFSFLIATLFDDIRQLGCFIWWFMK